MVDCRGLSAHACCMSKILLLFYRNFGLDQGRGQFADEKYQRREAGVVQDWFFSRTCQRSRNISWFRFSIFRKHVEHFGHLIVSRVYGYWSISRKKKLCGILVFSVGCSFPWSLLGLQVDFSILSFL